MEVVSRGLLLFTAASLNFVNNGMRYYGVADGVADGSGLLFAGTDGCRASECVDPHGEHS